QRRSRFAEDALEDRAPFEEGSVAKVVAADAQNVEGDQRHAVGRRAFGDVDSALKILKAGRFTFAVEGDDLAVEHHRCFLLATPFPQRRGDFWKLMCLLVAETRPQMHG